MAGARRGRWSRGGAVVGLAVAVSGCAGAKAEARADLRRALEVADELSADGAHAAAREQLTTAAGFAEPLAADELWLAVCDTFAREGQEGEAERCYLGLGERLAGDEGRALARYRAATLQLGRGDEPGAIALLEETINAWPGTDGGGRALRARRSLARLAGGPPAELALLAQVGERLCAAAGPGAAVSCCEVAIGGAQLALEERGEPAAANGWLDRCPAAGAGAWGDDLLWWRGRAARAQGDRRGEIDFYRQLIDRRESSWFVGSYESSYLDDAWLALAEALEAVGELESARRAYLELIDEAPRSRLVDDAAFGAARLDFARGERRALERFLDAFPDSRHAARARELLGQP